MTVEKKLPEKVENPSSPSYLVTIKLIGRRQDAWHWTFSGAGAKEAALKKVSALFNQIEWKREFIMVDDDLIVQRSLIESVYMSEEE